MILRQYQTPDILSEALYSECEDYRYRITRRWHEGAVVNFVMLNPSVADEKHNDPTVERCERRARMLGFGAFAVTNIFAWRDTDPHAMRRAVSPEGVDNPSILLETAKSSDLVIAAWGTHGAHRGQGLVVADMLRSNGITLHHLGLSKEGHPRHPLYVPYSKLPEEWIV